MSSEAQVAYAESAMAATVVGILTIFMPPRTCDAAQPAMSSIEPPPSTNMMSLTPTRASIAAVATRIAL